MNGKFYKILTVGVSCLLILSMLSGCVTEKTGDDGAQIATTPKPEPANVIAQISLSGYRFEEKSSALTDYIREFNKKYPGVEVSILHDDVSAEAYFDEIDSRIETGTAGSVVLLDNERMARYAAQGKLIPLGDYVSEMLDYDTYQKLNPETDLLPAAYAASKYNGRLYMAAIEYYHKFVFLNYDLLQSSGYDFPGDDWTWQDLIAMAQKLHKDGVETPVAMDYNDYAVWGAFARSYGTDIYDFVGNSSDVKAFNLTHPNVVQGLTDLANFVNPERGLVECIDASDISAEDISKYAFIIADHEDVAVWSEYLCSEECNFTWDYIHFPRWNDSTAENSESAGNESTEEPESTAGSEDASGATDSPSQSTAVPAASAAASGLSYYQSIGATVYGFAVIDYGKSDVYTDEYYRACAYLALYAMIDNAAISYAGNGESVPANKDANAQKFWREFPIKGKNSSVFSHFAETADFADNLSSFMPITSESEVDIGYAINAYLSGKETMVVALQKLQDYANSGWIED